MHAWWPKSVLRRSSAYSWNRGLRAALLLSALGMILVPVRATAAHPQTRQGFYMGLDFARSSAGVSDAGPGSSRESGWGGGFRLGYAVNPKVAIGFENNNFLEVSDVDAVTLNTFVAAVSVFPAEGLVLRGGFGAGTIAGGGGGLSGEAGTGWTVGAAYEFRVARSFAIGPQIDYSGVNLQYVDFNYYNVGLGMTWYFIPSE